MAAVPHIIRSLDVSIYYLLTRFAANPILCRVARFEESDNLLKGAVFFAFFWHFWFRERSEQQKTRCDIVAILSGSIVAIVAARAIAFLAPFRLRPMNDPTLLHPVYALSFRYNLEHWSAFPSDTAAYFFVLAIGVAWLSRRAAIPILVYTFGWVCLLRMFLGIHYASDIAAGIAIAVAVGLFLLKSELFHSLVAQPLVAMAARSGEWFYPAAFLISFEMATVFEGSRTFGNAAYHAVAAALHLRHLGTVEAYSPTSTWGGLVGTAICLAILIWLGRKLLRKFRSLPTQEVIR